MKVSLSITLFIIFLILKLCHVIGWSWWVITFPLWLPFALFACILIGIIGLNLLGLSNTRFKKRSS